MNPLKDLVTQEFVESSDPVIKKRGMEILSFEVFCSDSGEIEKWTGIDRSMLCGWFWIKNWTFDWQSFARNFRLRSHFTKYVMLMYTPWYDSNSAPVFDFNSNSNSYSFKPAPIFVPDGRISVVWFNRVIGLFTVFINASNTPVFFDETWNVRCSLFISIVKSIPPTIRNLVL